MSTIEANPQRRGDHSGRHVPLTSLAEVHTSQRPIVAGPSDLPTRDERLRPAPCLAYLSRGRRRVRRGAKTGRPDGPSVQFADELGAGRTDDRKYARPTHRRRSQHGPARPHRPQAESLGGGRRRQGSAPTSRRHHGYRARPSRCCVASMGGSATIDSQVRRPHRLGLAHRRPAKSPAGPDDGRLHVRYLTVGPSKWRSPLGLRAVGSQG